MNTKSYLQELVKLLDESLEWNDGVIMGLYQEHDKADTDSAYYKWLDTELPRLQEVKKKTIEAKLTLVKALKLVEHYE
jgi:hypothetical protein